MCRFIHAVLPKDADVETCVAVFRAHRRACVAHTDPMLAAQIGNKASSYCTTVGHCDCDSLLGCAYPHGAAGRGKTPEAAASRMRSKGWSEAKIARALAQQSEADSRPRSPIRGELQQTALDEWCALIRDVLALAGAAYVGLLIYDHNRGSNDESIALQKREVVPVRDLSETTLAAMRSNTIYEFHR
jgi:hypothetical protein